MPSSRKNIESITTTSSDAVGKSFLSFNLDTDQTVVPTQISYNGNTLSFANTTAFLTFCSEVVLPTVNLIHSPSLAGGGYAAATMGATGSDGLTA